MRRKGWVGAPEGCALAPEDRVGAPEVELRRVTRGKGGCTRVGKGWVGAPEVWKLVH